MRRNYAKIERNITLSIQYARLLKELSETEQKKLMLKDKKGVRKLKNKQIKKTNTHAEEVSDIIKNIIARNKVKEYSIVIDNTLDKYLDRLSCHEYFEMVKFNIALNTILDSSITYRNSDKYLEDISELLYQDKYLLQTIQKDIGELYLIFNNETSENKALALAHKLPVNIDMAHHLLKGRMKKLSSPLVLSFAFMAGGEVHKILKKRKMVHKFRKLSSSEFDYLLTTTLLSLVYAEKILPEEKKRKYFSSKLKTINITRAALAKELFEEFYDVKENLVKIKQLNMFDKYLMEKMKFYV